MIHNLPEDQAKLLAALQAIEDAAKNPTEANLAKAEQATAEAKRVATNHDRVLNSSKYAAPTMQTLEERRDARLYREAWQSLTPKQQKAFEAQQGDAVRMRRAAEQAKQIADSNWEQRMIAEQSKQLESGMWEGQMFRETLPAADYNKLYQQAEQLEQKRAERLKARAERELTAEAYDEEPPRLLASMDAEEQQIFMQLMHNQPSPLQALQQFVAAQGINPIAEVTDSAQLYEMGEPSNPPGTFLVANETDELYKNALEEIHKGE